MIARLVLAVSALSLTLVAQDPRATKADQYQLRVTPTELTLPIGEKATLKAELLDIGGRPAEGEVFFFSRARRSVRVSQNGRSALRIDSSVASATAWNSGLICFIGRTSTFHGRGVDGSR